MKAIFGILFAVLAGLTGARLAGYAVDLLLDMKRFTSPDHVDMYDLIAKVGITLTAAALGAFLGVWVAGKLRGRFIRREN
jgi:hypothetical protein